MEIYYSIMLRLEQASNKMFVQQEKDEMFLSPHGLLAGLNKMARLDSEDLAVRFMEAYMPRLQTRYGVGVQVCVSTWKSSKLSKRDLVRIQRDSDIARKRLDTGILAANQRLE